MRWWWIDKFVEFESGKRAVAIKNLSLAEEHLHDHFPGFPVMPPSLMIEGMAQTAGILVGEARDFAEKVILAKVRRAVFNGIARPGQGWFRPSRDGGDVETRPAGEGHVVGQVDLGPGHQGPLAVHAVQSHVAASIPARRL